MDFVVVGKIWKSDLHPGPLELVRRGHHQLSHARQSSVDVLHVVGQRGCGASILRDARPPNMRRAFPADRPIAAFGTLRRASRPIPYAGTKWLFYKAVRRINNGNPSRALTACASRLLCCCINKSHPVVRELICRLLVAKSCLDPPSGDPPRWPAVWPIRRLSANEPIKSGYLPGDRPRLLDRRRDIAARCCQSRGSTRRGCVDGRKSRADRAHKQALHHVGENAVAELTHGQRHKCRPHLGPGQLGRGAGRHAAYSSRSSANVIPLVSTS